MNELNHIGIIMDGNGRWGKKCGKSRFYGHESGVDTFEKTIEWCIEEHIQYLSVFAFSTENWSRSDGETRYLLRMFKKFLKSKQKILIEKGIQFKVIGDLSALDPQLLYLIEEIHSKTKHNNRISVQFCFNYGGRNEIIRAVNRIVHSSLELCGSDRITEEVFERYLDTHSTPDVDLVIRTGKHQRLSNFMIWQSTYAEIFFSKKLWPDFDKEELLDAIEFYKKSQRKFGGLIG